MQLQFPKMPEQMTRSESRILEYISDNTDEFIFAPISAVSRRLGVSVATISRFVRHMGCRDYKELRRIVAKQIPPERPADQGEIFCDGGKEFTAKNWLRRQQLCLQKTMEGLDEEAFRQAVSALLSARRVFLYARGTSSSIGKFLMLHLRRLGVEALLMSSGTGVPEDLAQLREDDLVILFGFSGVSGEERAILEYRKEAGYRTVALCSRIAVPEDERADIQLFVYRGEPGEYHSMTAPAAVADALAAAVSEQMGEKAEKRLSALREMKRRYVQD